MQTCATANREKDPDAHRQVSGRTERGTSAEQARSPTPATTLPNARKGRARRGADWWFPGPEGGDGARLRADPGAPSRATEGFRVWTEGHVAQNCEGARCRSAAHFKRLTSHSVNFASVSKAVGVCAHRSGPLAPLRLELTCAGSFPVFICTMGGAQHVAILSRAQERNTATGRKFSAGVKT